jgi:hypothetical protein
LCCVDYDAVQSWKGRKLDVIVAATREKAYSADSDRARSEWHLRLYSDLFWRQLLQAVGKVYVNDPSRLPSGYARHLRRYINPPVLEEFERACLEPEEVELVDRVATSLGAVLCRDDMRMETFLAIGSFPDHSPMQDLRQLLVRLAEEGQLPEDVVAALFEGPEGPDGKYVRCVAVATWPPAWLKQQGEAAAANSSGPTSSTSSSSSSSGDVVWVADAGQLEESSAGRAPYSRAQAALWYNRCHGMFWEAQLSPSERAEIAAESSSSFISLPSSPYLVGDPVFQGQVGEPRLLQMLCLYSGWWCMCVLPVGRVTCHS